jgi:hypothetical protein
MALKGEAGKSTTIYWVTKGAPTTTTTKEQKKRTKRRKKKFDLNSRIDGYTRSFLDIDLNRVAHGRLGLAFSRRGLLCGLSRDSDSGQSPALRWGAYNYIT